MRRLARKGVTMTSHSGRSWRSRWRPGGHRPEVVLKALRHADVYERCRPLGIGDRATLDRATGWVDAGDLRFDV